MTERGSSSLTSVSFYCMTIWALKWLEGSLATSYVNQREGPAFSPSVFVSYDHRLSFSFAALSNLSVPLFCSGKPGITRTSQFL